MSDIEVDKIAFVSGTLCLTGDQWRPTNTDQVALGTVLFIHGGGQTRHSWARVARSVAENGWRAVTFDLRGHGDSDWAVDGDYSIEAYSDDLQCVINQLGDAPVLVGASVGGSAALMVAARDPVAARALVLVDSAVDFELAGGSRVHDFMMLGVEGFASLDDAAAAVMNYKGESEKMAEVDKLHRNLRQDRDGLWRWRWDPATIIFDEPPVEVQFERTTLLRAAARRVSLPTLVIRGMDSDVVSEAAVEEMEQLIPRARVVCIPRVGHMTASDDNDAVADAIANYLNGIRETSRSDDGGTFDVTDFRSAAYRLAEAVRELIEAVVMTDTSGDERDAVARELDQLTARLSRRRHTDAFSGLLQKIDLDRPHSYVPLTPMAGLFNPIAPPLRLRVDNGRVFGEVILGRHHSGPAGIAHGGSLASLCDQMVGIATWTVGLKAFTTTLSVRFRRAVPLGVRLELESWVDAAGDRGATATAVIRARGEDCVTAVSDLKVVDFRKDRRKSEPPSTENAPWT